MSTGQTSTLPQSRRTLSTLLIILITGATLLTACREYGSTFGGEPGWSARRQPAASGE